MSIVHRAITITEIKRLKVPGLTLYPVISPSVILGVTLLTLRLVIATTEPTKAKNELIIFSLVCLPGLKYTALINMPKKRRAKIGLT
jgi:hypothetical protein